MRVHDQPRHFVGFVGYDLLLEEMRQRHIGQRELRRHALAGRVRRNAGQQVAAAQRSRLGQQVLQVSECVANPVYGVREGHVNPDGSRIAANRTGSRIVARGSAVRR